MDIPQKRSRRSAEGLIAVTIMSLIFMVLSYLRIAGYASSAALGQGVLEAVLAQPILGTQLGTEIIQYIGAVTLLHLGLALAAWALARLTVLAFPHGRTSQCSLAVLWCLILFGWALVANAALFPRTALGDFYADWTSVGLMGVSVHTLLTVAVVAAILATAVAAAWRNLAALRQSRLAFMCGSAALAVSVALPTVEVLGGDRTGASQQPHVIVIGVDSLRSDFVGDAEQQWTPNIDEFLGQSASFSNALTPLARTFPAWVSILTGRHPHTTGAFVNLLPRDLIEAGPTLPQILGQQGYRSIYAIDEVRFSNLDLSYGFDEMIAPPMGAADFMLGFFADTPLANLLVNTRLGAWLLPYAHANRAVAATYDPDTFIDRIAGGVSFEQPTFLAVHFTLAHWPYVWAGSPEVPSPGGWGAVPMEVVRERYELAVRRVDAQFGQLMEALQSKGALENSIVVLLADHGESIGDESPIADRDQVLDSMLGANSLYGHGTHVFSPEQYNVILGLRSFGNDAIPASRRLSYDVPVSLEDVAPTLLGLADVGTAADFDGRSLLPYLQAAGVPDQAQTDRVRFLETEFNPPGFSPGEIMTSSALTTAADKYLIDPDTDRVEIRPDFLDELLAKRQYAAELDGTILATIPAEDYRSQHLVLFDPDSEAHVWLDEPPTAGSGDAKLLRLWNALQNRFVPVRNRPVLARPAGAGSQI